MVRDKVQGGQQGDQQCGQRVREMVGTQGAEIILPYYR